MARMTKVKKVVAKNMDEALEKFLMWKRAQGISDQTLLDYSNHVGLFFRRFPAAKTSYEELEEAVYDHMGQENIKPPTYNNRLVYLRTFFAWCVDNEIMPDNPLSNFKKRKDEGRVVNINEDVLRALIALPDQSTYAGLRDYALFLTFLDCGVRPKEAFSLMEDDFNPQAHELYLRASAAKTRVSRTLHLTTMTVKAIQDLLSVRPDEWKGMAPIFATNEGKPLNRFTWGDRVEKYCKDLGTHIRPYDLRHSFALLFLRGKGNALALQKMLGHADLTMTKRYVALTNDDLKEQHDMASPISRLMPAKKKIVKLK